MLFVNGSNSKIKEFRTCFSSSDSSASFSFSSAESCSDSSSLPSFSVLLFDVSFVSFEFLSSILSGTSPFSVFSLWSDFSLLESAFGDASSEISYDEN